MSSALERRHQQDEAADQALVNEVIKKEVGNNFKLFGMWAVKYGVQEALTMLKNYEAKIQKEKVKLILSRTKRGGKGLRSQDIVVRV